MLRSWRLRVNDNGLGQVEATCCDYYAGGSEPGAAAAATTYEATTECAPLKGRTTEALAHLKPACDAGDAMTGWEVVDNGKAVQVDIRLTLG